MITFLTRKCFKIFCTIIIEIFIQCENNAKDKKNIKLFQIVGSTSNKNRLKSKCKTKEWVNLNFPSKGDRVKFVAQVNIHIYKPSKCQTVALTGIEAPFGQMTVRLCNTAVPFGRHLVSAVDQRITQVT